MMMMMMIGSSHLITSTSFLQAPEVSSIQVLFPLTDRVTISVRYVCRLADFAPPYSWWHKRRALAVSCMMSVGRPESVWIILLSRPTQRSMHFSGVHAAFSHSPVSFRVSLHYYIPSLQCLCWLTTILYYSLSLSLSLSPRSAEDRSVRLSDQSP